MGRGPGIAEGHRVAHPLDRKAIAEGVESEEQAKMLRLLKCDEMQGYFFSRPLSADDVEVFLRPAASPAPSVR
jgi:EAL domain-containing protein (putative c-di-GMP-specific phosphodiesterase class I)